MHGALAEIGGCTWHPMPSMPFGLRRASGAEPVRPVRPSGPSGFWQMVLVFAGREVERLRDLVELYSGQSVIGSDYRRAVEPL